MMAGSTLNWYLARHFLRYVLFIYLLFLFLIMSVDMIELSRAASKRGESLFTEVFLIAALRAPGLAQRVLPFAVLFGAATSLLLLTKKLELVVARASGISVWRFIAPLLIAASLVGGFTALIYNPAALYAHRISQGVEADAFGRVKGSFTNKSKNFWLRTGQAGGEVIIRAGIAQDSGRKLTDVSIYRFGEGGAIKERIDAVEANFVSSSDAGNHYTLDRAVLTKPGEPSKSLATIKVPVNISDSELQINSTLPSNVNFWSLGTQAERAATAGRSPLPFQTHFQSLLVQPLLFVAMVLIAAGVSLRFARFGQSGRLILGGVLAGFVLYVASEVVLTFGRNGIVSPAAAAWSPSVVAILLGITVLLHQEDG